MRSLFFFPFFLFGAWNTATEEEALSLRRISEFWEEGEMSLVQSQGEQFLSAYPDSPSADSLRLSLGDLSLREKNYTQGIALYQAIRDPDVQKKALLSKLYCLLQLGWFSTLIDECEKALAVERSPEVAFYLSSALSEQAFSRPQETSLLILRIKELYQELKETPYGIECGKVLAHLLTQQGSYGEGASLYEEMGDRLGAEQRGELLYRAALLKGQVAPEEGLSLLKALPKTAEIQEQIASMELHLNHCQEALEVLEGAPSFPNKDLLTAEALIGLGRVHEGSALVLAAMENREPSLLVEEALIALLEKSAALGEKGPFEQALSAYIEHFGNNSYAQTALLLHARLLSDLGQYGEAKKILSSLAPTEETEREAIYLAAKERSFDECLRLAEKFPHAKGDDPVFRYKVEALLALGKREELCRELKENGTDEHAPLLAQVLYELGNLQEAKEIALHLDSADGQILLGLILAQGEGHVKEGIALIAPHIKKANILTPYTLHLFLFNAHLALNEIPEAAEALFAASLLGPIGRENLSFLASYYYEKGQLDRAIPLLEQIPLEDDEEASLLLADSYHREGLFEARDELLAVLLQRPLPPLLKAQSELIVGEAMLHDKEKAQSYFSAFCEKYRPSLSYPVLKGMLHLARLSDKEVAAPLLKTIVLHKSVKTEPLHLEAALDYVNLMGREKRLDLLKKVKSDFSESTDLLSTDYQQSRALFPRQNKILQAYLAWVDLQIDEAIIERNGEIAYKERSNRDLALVEKWDPPQELLLRMSNE